ncbi:Permease cytosine/purines uracil thiamine allantoin [Macrophomina phaseolina MS6]|uniref:Permease cytosine/purines uracil thiamine allantoin n=1 Tax=Macrophomina phaseolina (strain MS6) TaxID=1126212 RepID=K2RK46_MACPH|nr:Permease cytosine/purines uracil thiamine allantoin [Macrophomina phaseolina MS6]
MEYVDVEKRGADAEVSSGSSNHKAPPGVVTAEEGAVPGESFVYGNSLYAKIQRLAGRFNIEQRGIERVPENERNDTSLLNVGTMWLSANMVVSSFAIGLLAKSLFYLGVADAMIVCLFFNILGILPVCFFSSLGPVFGLRQMVLSRFWFGWWGVKLIACFNVCACIGWSAVNSIVGAELIHAVNDDVPGWAGIVIIAICTFFVTLFGYKVVHAYEFWSWIPTFIIFLIVLGTFAHSGAYVHIPWETGKSEMGGVLSFGVTVYGFATGWASYAADYTVYQPSTQSRRKVFLSTACGLLFPLLFTEMLGIAVMSATAINGGDNRYQAGYDSAGTGGLLAAVLFPPLGGFGKFCLVILALSIIANNCPNIYSIALTVQVFGRWAQAVPRPIWTLLGTGVYIGIAIPGYSHFETVLENFMNFIGYWLSIYEGIALTDHFLFRRGTGGYVPEHYDQPSKLPPGIAAVLAFGFGVAGMVTGMSQTWYVGKIALHAGEAPFGGDVGFELGFAFAAVSYAVLRNIELRVFGR